MKKTLFIVGCSVLVLIGCNKRSMDQGAGSQSGENTANQTGGGGRGQGVGAGGTALPGAQTNSPTNSATPTPQ